LPREFGLDFLSNVGGSFNLGLSSVKTTQEKSNRKFVRAERADWPTSLEEK